MLQAANDKESANIDWDDVVFEVDLLKSQEINLDYIEKKASIILALSLISSRLV
jgi:type I site-specific restriction-modification system R (restriction) subunit